MASQKWCCRWIAFVVLGGSGVLGADSVTAVLDAGGQRVSNGSVTHDGSLGGLGGSPSQSTTVAKQGYTGQLYDLRALELAATPLAVDEDGTRQVTAALVMDDDTSLAAGEGFGWSVTAGPATVDGAGLVSGQPVYQDELATVEAMAGAAAGSVALTVLNTLPDNFGSYAADGIDDDWQVQFFGLGNPLAGPLHNPDFDGQNNRFEFLAKVDPTDANSFFEIEAAPVAGQPGQQAVVFEPRFPDRNYTVETSTTLGALSWVPLVGGSVSDDGAKRTVTDPNATGPRKFYRVEISR